MSTFKPISPDRLVLLYKLNMANTPYSQIEEKTKIGNPWQAFNKLKGYLDGKPCERKNYLEAVKIIKSSIPAENNNIQKDLTVRKGIEIGEGVEILAPDFSEVKDPYQILSQSFDMFTNSLTVFIDAMVDKKAREIKKELRTVKQEKEELQTKYDELVNKAKESNWVSNLRNKF